VSTVGVSRFILLTVVAVSLVGVVYNTSKIINIHRNQISLESTTVWRALQIPFCLYYYCPV